jgi:hypothetical protein
MTFARACARVRPWLIAPGTSGIVASTQLTASPHGQVVRFAYVSGSTQGRRRPARQAAARSRPALSSCLADVCRSDELWTHQTYTRRSPAAALRQPLDRVGDDGAHVLVAEQAAAGPVERPWWRRRTGRPAARHLRQAARSRQAVRCGDDILRSCAVPAPHHRLDHGRAVRRQAGARVPSLKGRPTSRSRPWLTWCVDPRRRASAGGARPTGAWPTSPVDVSAVAHPKSQDEELVVVDLVDDAAVARVDSPRAGIADQPRRQCGPMPLWMMGSSLPPGSPPARAPVAQWIEQRTSNPQVPGSNPGRGALKGQLSRVRVDRLGSGTASPRLGPRRWGSQCLLAHGLRRRPPRWPPSEARQAPFGSIRRRAAGRSDERAAHAVHALLASGRDGC